MISRRRRRLLGNARSTAPESESGSGPSPGALTLLSPVAILPEEESSPSRESPNGEHGGLSFSLTEGPEASSQVGRFLPVHELICPSEIAEPLELVVRSSLTGDVETVRVDASLVVIGRSSRSDLRLIHPDVSRRHACLHVVRGGVLCVDLESRSGVHANGARRSAVWLSTEIPVRIGPYEILLAEERPRGTVPNFEPDLLLTRPAVAEAEAPSAGLQVYDRHDGSCREIRLRRPITLVGRGENCKLRLLDDSVSLVHSSILLTPEGVWVSDLLSRAGVRVNGRFVSRALLSPGDEVEIGRYRMRFAHEPDDAVPTLGEESEPAQAPSLPAQAPPAAGMVSESFVLAIVETFADMQRQMNEQFRFQMEMMAGLVESARAEVASEVREEFARLRQICEEMRDAQRSLVQPPPSAAGGEISATLPSRPRGDGTSRSPEASVPREHRTAAPGKSDTSRGNGAVDHAVLMARLRDLERERSTRWERLMSFLK